MLFRIDRLWDSAFVPEPKRGERKPQREAAHNPGWRSTEIKRPKRSNVIRLLLWPLLSCWVVEKCDDRYKGQSSFLLQLEVQHGNHIDCRFGAVFARWRGLGILSLAQLARFTG